MPPSKQRKDERQDVDIPDDLEVESNTVRTHYDGSGSGEPSFDLIVSH